jgi:hypothetical protein
MVDLSVTSLRLTMELESLTIELTASSRSAEGDRRKYSRVASDAPPQLSGGFHMPVFHNENQQKSVNFCRIFAFVP